jgi:ribokinase
MGKVVVVGSANTDLVLMCAHLPQVGETITGEQFFTADGGKGANQAVSAARLGAEVTFISRLGTDWIGDQALAHYMKEGIRCEYVTRDPVQPSGQALIFVDRAGKNMIGVAPGANATLTPEHISQAEAVIRQADVLLIQLEIPLETVEAAIHIARQHGILTILNPAPASPLPPELIRGVILTPNEIETAVLVGSQVETVEDARKAALQLVAQGARAVIVTLGERGACLVDASQSLLLPAYQVDALDTTAAGDAFNAGLACSLANGTDLVTAARYASAVAALAVTVRGAQPSLPTAERVSEFLQTAHLAK